MSNKSLIEIQKRFHDLISERAGFLEGFNELKLPELNLSILCEGRKVWFPVPGMYGGFSYWLEKSGDGLKLITESWCRVVEGSGQRHEITNQNTKLVNQGFV